MKKILVLAGCLAMLSPVTFSNFSGNNDKVVVCHIPPGNPANKHTIVISSNALQTHLNHGDIIGSCESVISPPNQDCFYTYFEPCVIDGREAYCIVMVPTYCIY